MVEFDKPIPPPSLSSSSMGLLEFKRLINEKFQANLHVFFHEQICTLFFPPNTNENLPTTFFASIFIQLQKTLMHEDP